MFSPLPWTVFWPRVGEFCLGLALAAGLFTTISAVMGHKKKDERFILSAERALYATFFMLSFAVAILVLNLVQDNFLVRYVYAYSNRAMPLVYKFTALWGGQDGSLLFWVWLSSVYAVTATFIHRHRDRPLLPHAMAVFGAILSFFTILLIYSDNPFKLFPETPFDGRGLNPLLQNPSMAIHPPSLYLGYTGMSVPFAFGMAALLSNQLDNRWIMTIRIWTLISWFFLSIGNLLGAQWAYVELGWGGFWAWDPVENAAIMPWLTASAFLHSVMIQEKRGMLKFWNMNLVVISFCLTILGTYLTRSGVVQSVHSFARSSIGYYFIVFLGFTILFSALWIYKRRKELRSENIFESFLSKESAFVVNNIVLVGAAFFILYATLFPTFSELLTGNRIIVGPPYFNKLLAPIGLILLVLTGIGPMIAWRKASKRNLERSFTWPLIFGLIAMGCLALLHITHWYVLLTGFGAAFVLTTIVMEFVKGTSARRLQYKENLGIALLKTLLKNNRRYGGYIVHLGIVFIFVGIAGTAYKEVYDFGLKPGDVVSFRQYTIQMKDFEIRENENQEETYALLDLYDGPDFLTTVRPARFYYKLQEQPSTEVDIYSRFHEDIYFTLGTIDPNSREAKIQVTLNPMISWLWAGGLVLILGGILAMMPSLSTRSQS